jgi:hypothetical protein
MLGGAGCASEETPTTASELAAAKVMTTDKEEGAGEAAGEAGASATKPAESEALRVLVTGFNDWKELGDPPNIWLCKVNPSCRLLLGAERRDKPDEVDGGELLPRLRALTSTTTGRPVEWNFATLPVTWQVSEELSIRDYDLVIHLGLGVYDRFDRLMLERGAFNQRRGKDAAGQMREEKIEASGGDIKPAHPSSATGAILDRLDGRSFGGYSVKVAGARPDNSYLCNETHYRALLELDAARESGARLQRVHFLHIPYAEHGDYAKLAEGVAGLVAALLPGDSEPTPG